MKSMEDVIDHLEKGRANNDWTYIDKVHETLTRLQRKSQVEAMSLTDTTEIEGADIELTPEQQAMLEGSVEEQAMVEGLTPKPARRKKANAEAA